MECEQEDAAVVEACTQMCQGSGAVFGSVVWALASDVLVLVGAISWEDARSSVPGDTNVWPGFAPGRRRLGDSCYCGGRRLQTSQCTLSPVMVDSAT